MINYQEKYEALLKEFEQYKKESIKWSAEDFYYLAEEMGYQITWEQSQEALEDMIKHHDAGYGISWDSVAYGVEKYGRTLIKIV
jgi:hypothetical protein